MVIDDGSTDKTSKILRTFTDRRLRVIHHECNKGLIESLNAGIDLARGRFLARMDADDVAKPRRLERQVNFLEAHAEVGVCGTWFRIRGSGRTIHVRPPTTHAEIAATLFFRSAFGHPTVMLRHAVLQKTGLRYDALAVHAEDFDLWVRLRDRTKLANLPDYLLDYRAHPTQISSQYPLPQSESAARIRLRQLGVMLPNASGDEQRLHLRTCDTHVFRSKSELLEARSWLDFLQDINRKISMFSPGPFGMALSYAWFHCCARTVIPPYEVFRIHFSRRYSPIGLESFRAHVGFALRAFRRRTPS